MKKFVWKCLKPFFELVRPSFTFNGKAYSYFWHDYNMTWRSERCIEIPIVYEIVKENGARRILEVGNVLSHYFNLSHDIVDKYEKAEGVINEDIATFRPKAAYDLIISISTMEHVGWDEEPKEPEKLFKAFENIKNNCLAPGGKLVVTIPVDYNPFLDQAIASEKLAFTQKYFMRRLSKINHWRQAGLQEVQETKFMKPYPFANGMMIAIFEKEPA